MDTPTEPFAPLNDTELAVPVGGTLCVILPALNEEATLGEVIDRIPAIDGLEVKVIVVNDGSTDRTPEIALEKGAQVISHSRPRGVGAAFHSGIEAALEAGADYVVNIDSDGQFSPEDIPKLLEPVRRGEADFATCSRFKDKALVPQMPVVKRFGNAAVAWIVSSLIGKRFYDVACGFRAFHADAVMRLNLFGEFTYTQETFIDLAFKGLKIVEVPLKVRGEREYGESRVASSILRYAKNTSRIILSTFKDYRPFTFFFALSGLFGTPGLGLASFFVWHFLSTGHFSPHLWAGFLSGALLGTSLVFLVIAITVESHARLRLTLERTLYFQKKQYYEGLRSNRP
ncbi:MAG: glycosyltransferase [Deltaproteobacteria bacterium]|nr:glycosyltransferase [Deltaproteobacteria bacterium]